jgi:protein-S-isoprenylcysteine O-methyltransferase Ste14
VNAGGGKRGQDQFGSDCPEVLCHNPAASFNQFCSAKVPGMTEHFANPLSIVATAILIVACIWLGVRGGIIGTGLVSLSLQLSGLLIVAWARLAFGFRSFHFAASPTQGGLVTRGPYRYVRNPIYSGALLVIVTGMAVHFSLGNLSLALVAVVSLLTRMLCEERLLPATYPEYVEYARRTPRLVPFLI